MFIKFVFNYHKVKTFNIIEFNQLHMFFKGFPKLEDLVAKDREFFLHILKLDIPLQILVDNIKSDTFWKRYYSSKWTDFPIQEYQKPWINIFMERYYADILENMNPRHYDPEKVSSFSFQNNFLSIVTTKSFLW